MFCSLQCCDGFIQDATDSQRFMVGKLEIKDAFKADDLEEAFPSLDTRFITELLNDYYDKIMLSYSQNHGQWSVFAELGGPKPYKRKTFNLPMAIREIDDLFQ